MASHKYNYNVTDIAALEAAYPKAVETEKKPVRSVITKLLDCGATVPGVELVTDSTATEEAPAPTIAPATEPRTLGKMISKSVSEFPIV